MDEAIGVLLPDVLLVLEDWSWLLGLFLLGSWSQQSLSLPLLRWNMEVQANMNKGRKVIFETLNQLHIQLTESTANVDFVLSTIQQAWGLDHITVTSDGLRIDNSPATQGILTCTVCGLVHYFIIAGLAFWKAPS